MRASKASFTSTVPMWSRSAPNRKWLFAANIWLCASRAAAWTNWPIKASSVTASLNFGLASKRAQLEGINVDSADVRDSSVGKRGLGGVIHKIAGALEQRLILADIKSTLEQILWTGSLQYWMNQYERMSWYKCTYTHSYLNFFCFKCILVKQKKI